MKFFKIRDETYDFLKYCCNKVPLIITFYCTIAGLWGFQYTEQIVGTVSAIHALVCGFLEISTKYYNSEGE